MLEGIIIGVIIGIGATLLTQKMFGFGSGRTNEVPGGSGRTSRGDNVKDPKDPNKPHNNR